MLLYLSQAAQQYYGISWGRKLTARHNSLPDTFTPYIHLESPHDFLSSNSASPPPSPFPEIVFSSAVHASAMVLYNSACLILLLNRPYDSHNTPRDPLVRYREITKQVDSCAQEISGIGIGTAVQIHQYTSLVCVTIDQRPVARWLRCFVPSEQSLPGRQNTESSSCKLCGVRVDVYLGRQRWDSK
jgi:hypothetical protein